MSSIVGIFRFDRDPIDATDLHRMLNRFSYRHPHGKTVWTAGHVGLGHGMFRTTPESLNETMPFIEPNRGLVIIADARIDNREELQESFGCPDLPDSQLILRAYEKWGEECPAHLLGDFAFAIWDAKHYNIFCARDHVGIKPFYYSSTPQQFVFASEIKAVLQIKDIPKTLNESFISNDLSFRYYDHTSTFFKAVLRLPPATSMTITPQGIRQQAFWTPSPLPTLRLTSDNEYTEAFREIFSKAVHCRLRSLGHVGCPLSGGLDSSSIVAVARDMLPDGKKLQTISGVYDQFPECDERQYFHRVIAQGNVTPHFVYPERINPWLGWRRPLLSQDDQPCNTGQPPLYWEIYDLCRKQNIPVLLTGEAGEGVTGNGRVCLREFFDSMHFLRFFRESYWFSRREQKRLTSILAYSLSHAKTAQEEQVRILRSFFFPLAFEKINQLSNFFQTETRFPYLDKRVIDFFLAIPPTQRLSHGYDKIIVRRAFERKLPEEIVWRPKTTRYARSLRWGFQENGLDEIVTMLRGHSDRISSWVDLRPFQPFERESLKNILDSERFWELRQVVTLLMWMQIQDE